MLSQPTAPDWIFTLGSVTIGATPASFQWSCQWPPLKFILYWQPSYQSVVCTGCCLQGTEWNMDLQCAVYSVQCTVCFVQCELCTVQCKCRVCSMPCAVFSVPASYRLLADGAGTLQYPDLAPYCALYRTVQYGTVQTQHRIVHCTVQYAIVQYKLRSVLFNVQYSTVQYHTVQYSIVVQYFKVQYRTVQ